MFKEAVLGMTLNILHWNCICYNTTWSSCWKFEVDGMLSPLTSYFCP